MVHKSLEQLKDLVGASKTVVEGFEIEAGKVAEFAAAIGATDDVYFDESVAADRGHPAIPAPITFITTSNFPRYRTTTEGTLGFDFGFDDRYLVHGEQAYDVSQPMYVGNTLTGVSTVDDVYERDGKQGGTMTFAIVKTSYTDEDDEHVITECATLIETAEAMHEGS